jgi:hypothetical protein
MLQPPLEFSGEVRDADLERPRDPADRHDGRGVLASLQPSHVGSVHMGDQGQLLLGDSSFLPKSAYALAQCNADLLFSRLRLFHVR